VDEAESQPTPWVKGSAPQTHTPGLEVPPGLAANEQELAPYNGACETPSGEAASTGPHAQSVLGPGALPRQLNGAAEASSTLRDLPFPPRAQRSPETAQKPMLLWCSEATGDSTLMRTVAKEFRHRHYLHFLTAVKFTRWLFEQHRGCITPWAILVAGFREAKPCMTAMVASQSGDTSKVRADQRRAALRSPLRPRDNWRDPASVSQTTKIAVGAFVVVLDIPAEQKVRAVAWAGGVRELIPDLDIYIVDDSEHLVQTLTALRIRWFEGKTAENQQQQHIRMSV